MGMTPEERRLLHQKGQQPTYGSGAPNPNDGKNGDIYFGKVGDEVVQYVKQDGNWVQVSSVSASETGISTQFGDQFISDAHEFFQILSKFKSTIKYWGASWAWSGMLRTNFSGQDAASGYESFGLGSLVQFLQMPGNEDALAANQLTWPGRAFNVPRPCKLVNINFIMLGVHNNTDVNHNYGFNLYAYESESLTNISNQDETNNMNFDYMEIDQQNSGLGTREFGVNIAPGASFGIQNVPVGAHLTIDRGYGIGIEQISNPDGYNVAKGSVWSAFFESTG